MTPEPPRAEGEGSETVTTANENQTDYLSTDQVAELLHMSTITLAAWRRDGKGPPFTRVGRWIRYARADIHAFMQAARVGAVAG